jgi:hypothetical protein
MSSGITDRPKILSDSITHTREMLREVLRAVPPEHRRTAKAAAVAIEKAFTEARQQAPRDPAVAIGLAFAIFEIADRLITLEQESNAQGSLIQLLN